MKNKIIRDNVHGYIEIPEDYFTKFIDTEAFQRLRGVEQTSMRCVYPCARHDRFAHSIGTYYLGSKTINVFVQNLKENNNNDKVITDCYKAFTPEEWKCIIKSFEIACLLHDCAHAPFSHVLEKYMDYYYTPKRGKAGLLVDLLVDAVGVNTREDDTDTVFADKSHLEGCGASKHEKASALLLWKLYKDDIESLGANPLWAMRMILGYNYTPVKNLKHEVLNCIIGLLNGDYIDVDKLDYIIRDTALSGVDNFSVDLKRLINSITIVKLHNGRYSIGYLKTSINVIQNIIPAKNNLYLWIYAHHKVQYYSYLLCQCYEKAVGILFGYDPSKDQNKILATCSHLISVDAMLAPIEVGLGEHKEISYLPSDADIMSLIKRAYHEKPDDPDFKELFSRAYKKSVWKSYAEYNNIFPSRKKATNKIMGKVDACSSDIIADLCKEFKDDDILKNKDSWVIFPVQAKLCSTKNAEIYIRFNGGRVKKFETSTNIVCDILPRFFYLFYSGETLSLKKKKKIAKIIKA